MKVITHVNVDGPAPLLLKESNTRHLPHSARYWIDKHIDVSLSLLTIPSMQKLQSMKETLSNTNMKLIKEHTAITRLGAKGTHSREVEKKEKAARETIRANKNRELFSSSCGCHSPHGIPKQAISKPSPSHHHPPTQI